MVDSVVRSFATLIAAIFVVCGAVEGYLATKNLKEIMIGRCWEYQRLINPQPFINNLRNCEDLWDKFNQAVSHQSPCGRQPAAFSEFIQATQHEFDRKRIVLWEKVSSLVTKFADFGKRLVSCDSTLPGYMAGLLVFCGDTHSPDGYNHEKCPSRRDCPDNAVGAYWKEASRQFAAMAEDTAYIMVNGSHTPTFRADSIFSEWELPNIRKDRVKTVQIMIVHNINGPIVETCSKGATVLPMKKKIQSTYGFKVECQDDPAAIRHFLCMDAVNAESCQLQVDRYIR